MLLADPPNNMIAQSQSGTGKTTALVLSMLSRVDATKNFPQVICISPTYELALQTGQVAEKMGKFCPEVKIGYAVRGERVSRGEKVTDHIIFATPGTLLDWILGNRALDPKKIKMFVLDEADVMIAQQGHQDQSIRIHKFALWFALNSFTALFPFVCFLPPTHLFVPWRELHSFKFDASEALGPVYM
ncbi:unnamed protein product [Porites evermanni]|uniref:Helicase ATP-binding domain-containing protein n=1 Tax=Porites evermanni TaxID=104178 RepID=A0ABN8MEZ5_9CNID|nr:unnamed protein product [Porites evermanni]